GHPPIGVARSVARGDVKHPIVTEYDSTAIMSGRAPLNNHLLLLCIASVWRLTLDRESRDPVGALLLRRRTIAAHKEVSVGAIARMKRHAVNQSVAHFEQSLRGIGLG